MKKIISFISLLVFFQSALCQGIMDTIEVSRNYKTILIFPEPIAESIIGNDLVFIVDLPKTNGSRFNNRILKLYYHDLDTLQRNFTNHTVITSSGLVFDFILELKDRPEKLTCHITPEMAKANIGTVSNETRNLETAYERKQQEKVEISDKDLVVKDITLANDSLYQNDTDKYYRLKAHHIQFNKSSIPREFGRNNDVFLWLKGIYFDRNEIYLQLKIKNNETLDFDVDFLKCFVESSYRKAPKQKVPINPDEDLLLLHKAPQQVKGKSESHFVMVLKKFTLDNKKRLLLELDGESGNRHIELRIHHSLFNNPLPIKI